MEIRTDYKQPRRIRDSSAWKRKLTLDSVCRNCGGRATDGHHLVLRSKGGDDVEDNICPLCHLCHIHYHDARIGLRLTLDERLYVLTKLGQDPGMAYMEKRRYVA